FKSVDNVIFVESTHSMVISHAQLNTVHRVSGEPFTRHISRAKQRRRERRWVEIAAPQSSTVLGRTQSVAGCSSQLHGSGGTIAGTFTSSVGEYAALDIAFALALIEAFGATYSTSVKSQFSVTGSYSCAIPAGHSGQILMLTFFKKFDNPMVRPIRVSHGRLLPVRVLEVGEWESAGKPV
ncbi:uncharacterized protein CANTADRAFT_28077, partial [Suhomyces tanzawaensis NRRL Y-17324]